MKKLLPLLLFLAAFGYATASKEEVLRAIDAIENEPRSFPEHIHTIKNFAENSNEVAIEISPERLPWLNDEKDPNKDTLYLGLYFAGMVKHQLHTGSKDNNPYDAWLYMLEIYDEHFKGTKAASDALDKLSEINTAGDLLQHAKEAE